MEFNTIYGTKTWWICKNGRKLHTIKQGKSKQFFPKNRVDDTLEKVARFLWYTDLKQNCYQILLHVDSIKYTAFLLAMVISSTYVYRSV